MVRNFKFLGLGPWTKSDTCQGVRYDFLKITFESKNRSQSSFFKDKENHAISSVDGNLLSFNFTCCFLTVRKSCRSTRLPPIMWLGFDSRACRYMWAEFVVGSRPCSERFFSGCSGFPFSSKTNIPRSQFGLSGVPN